LFDHVFVYHRNHVLAYADRDPRTIHWVPYACDTDVVRDLGQPRDLDVAFVGRLYTPERQRIIGALAHKYRMNEQKHYPQATLSNVYSRAKIVVDLPPGDYIAFRIFEALSCGALVLTKRIKSGLEELLEEGTHYIAFDDERELFEKVEFYVRDDEARQRIALRGYEEVTRNHTLALRIGQMLEIIRTGPAGLAPVRQMDKTTALKLYARVYERLGRVETLLRLAAEERPDKSVRAWLLAVGLKSFARRAVLGW